MKVVLIKDIRNMGGNGTVLDVSDGHAINFLFPRKMAIMATPDAIKKAELRKKQSDDKKAIDAELLTKNMESLSEARITIIAKANDQGHLYKSVSDAEIVAAAKAQAHVDLPEDVIKLENPIKEVGEYTVGVSAGKDFGSFVVIVEAE